ncbi:hypothetical protein AHF37_08161, partial [Paragonimus kellicotti]
IFIAPVSYSGKLKQYHSAYLQDRSQFRFYIEYILANANNAMVIAESFMSVMMQELAEDTQLKGRLQSQINQLKSQFGIVAEHCRLSAEETVMLDMHNVLKNVMTPQWLLPDDITASCFCGTLADYDETLRHVRPNIYQQLVDRLAERLLIEYMKVLLTRRCIFRSDIERRHAGEKILHDMQALRGYFEEKMNVKTEASPSRGPLFFPLLLYRNREWLCSVDVTTAYNALAAIAQFFLTTDSTMLSLDIANITREFPDIRPDQVYSILMARGDIRANVAKELASDDPNRSEAKSKMSPLLIFTKLADAMRQ